MALAANSHKRIIRFGIVIVMCLFICCAAISTPVSATSTPTPTETELDITDTKNLWEYQVVIRGEGETGDDVTVETRDLTEVRTGFNRLYNIIIAIVVPCGTVSFAIAAFRMMFGGEKGVESGRTQVILTCVAVACVYFIPAVVTIGANIGATYGWDPFNPS